MSTNNTTTENRIVKLGKQGLTVSAMGQRIDEAAPKGAASGERYEDMSAVNR